MNKFKFASANAAKLARLPLYVAMGMLALVFPRDRHLWVFGRKTGVGEGPLRLLRMAQRHYPHLRLVWIAQDHRQYEEARSLGLEAHRTASWRARWLTLRAGVGVVTHGMGDLCRPFVPGIHLVQLWHGSPLKRIHLDAPNAQLTGAAGWAGRAGAWLIGNMFKTSARMIRCIPSPSPRVSARFQSAWGWRDRTRIRLTGDPRCDVLLEGDAQSRRKQARQRLKQLWQVDELPSRLVLFAPTWRDGEPDPSLPDTEALRALQGVLATHDAWLVVRSHPWGVAEGGQAGAPSTALKFLDAFMLHDVNLVLNAFDVLITDYSAIALDYSLLRRPIVFLAPDLEAYQRTRGLYERYETFTGGTWHRDWRGVMAALASMLGDAREAARVAARTSERLVRRYHTHTDAHSAQRLLREIAADLAWPPPEKPTKPVEVLHVAGCLGGVETYLQLLASHVNAERLVLSFVLPQACALSRYAAAQGMPVAIVPMVRAIAPWKDFKAALALRRVVRRAAPSIVHLHSSKAGLIGRLACLGLPCKVIYTPHAYFFLARRGPAKALFMAAERWLDRLSGSITLGTSPSEARRAMLDIGCRPERVGHILNAIDVEDIARHRTGRRGRYVVLVARVSAQKNIPMYLDVVRRLRQTHHVPCYLVGVGHYADDRRELMQMLRAAGLDGDDVRIVEWMPRPDVLKLMAGAAAVVLTSRYESFGYVLAEACALGIPVIGTNVDGVKDVIRDGRNGYLVPLDDSGAMAARIRQLLDDPEAWRAMSEGAHSEAIERFDIRRAIPRFEQFYRAQLP